MTYLSAVLSILILVALGVINYQLGQHVQAKWSGWVIPAAFLIIRIIETMLGGTNAAEKVGAVLGGLIFGWLFWWLFQRGWRKVRPALAAKETPSPDSAKQPMGLSSESLTRAASSQSTSLMATASRSASVATTQGQPSLSASKTATSSQSTTMTDHAQN